MNEQATAVEWPFKVGKMEGRVALTDAPNAEATELELSFKVETEEELRDTVEMLGGIEKFYDPAHAASLLAMYRANEVEGGPSLTVQVWMGEALSPETPPPTAPAVARLLEEARGDVG